LHVRKCRKHGRSTVAFEEFGDTSFAEPCDADFPADIADDQIRRAVVRTHDRLDSPVKSTRTGIRGTTLLGIS